MTYPLASSSWDDEELAAMQAVISSGIFSMGAKVLEFEQRFAEYASSRYCVMVNSGSSANLLMVGALRYRKMAPLLPGAEVIVPAVSWSTTYYPLYQYGLKLKFVDIDKETLNYDLDQLAAAVSDETRAIMVVNLLGNPNDFSRIKTIVGDRSIEILEDNCESMGAVFSGKQAGTFGVMGSFSSFFSHHISTMEGGMILTDDEELYHILLALWALGWTRNLPNNNHVSGTKSDDPFVESFRFFLPGYNVRPLELSGAIGISQVKKLPGMISQRRKNAEQFLEIMKAYPFLRPQQEIGESSWFGFSMIVEPDAGLDRGKLVKTLTKHQIDVRPIVAGNFAKNPVLRWFDHSIFGSLSNADEVDVAGIFIGNHHYSMEREFEILKTALIEVSRQV